LEAFRRQSTSAGEEVGIHLAQFLAVMLRSGFDAANWVSELHP
jgi:hypothetical protein